MKLRVEIDGSEYFLDLRNGTYSLTGPDLHANGTVSLAAAGPDTYSLLIGHSSHTVRLTREQDQIAAYIADRQYRIRVSDARDRRSKTIAQSEGPLEIRSQMPGKVIKLLVKQGQDVEIGEGLVVVEAMKMQNEIKAQKSGTITRIAIEEGGTVSAGEVLLVVA